MRADLNYSNNSGRFLLSVSVAALALASSANAADYTAGTDQQLRDAIAAANASPDASSTIMLTGSFTVTAAYLPVPAKAITINTEGFTLTGRPGTATGALQFTSTGGNIVTINGNLAGGTGIPGTTTGGYGLWVQTDGGSSFVNNGSIAGGNGAAAGGRGGTGARTRTGTFFNNGTIQGGEGRGVLQGGIGIELVNTDLTNNSLIQGGSSAAAGGAGIQAIGGTANSLINTGTIRGGNGVSGSVLASGILWGTGFAVLDNQGTIEGGTGGSGIWSGTRITATNSGTIRAGSGQANAIMVGSGATAFLDLTLQAGSVIEGNVAANANAANDVLRLGGDANWALDGDLGSAGQYRNFDTLEKTGASTWTVNSSGDFAGATNILAGKLLVNGSLAGSAVTVASGATLGGSGTVGATTIAAGGTIAPGSSIGTVTVNGAFMQAAGSTYQVEVDPGTVTSDRIAVNGTATLARGASISVINYTGAAYVAGQRYTILTSTGLTGTYGFPEQVLTAFLSLRDAYDANNAYLAVVQTRSVGEVGTTPNEVEVGKGVDSLPTGNPVQGGVLNQPSVDAARRALNELSGEIHASAKTALIEESWLLRAAINDRLRSAFGSVGAATLNYSYTADLAPSARRPMPVPQRDHLAVWGQGYGAWGKTDSDGNAAQIKRSTGGFLIGGDAAVFDNLRFGAVAGYSRSDFDIASRASSGESDNYHIGLYGGGQWGAINLRAGASYTWHDVDTRRAVSSAFIGSAPRASYDAATAQVFGEAGYRIDLGRVALEPFAGLAYVNLHTDGFSETGAATALTAQGDDTGVGYSTLGLRASSSFDLQGMAMTVRGGLGWRHAFGDVAPKTTLAFAGSSAFIISGVPIARDSAIAEAGFDVAIGRGATLGLSYAGQLAESAQDHSFKGVLAVKF
jgi:outer membrane autotransporter protein